MEDKDKDKRIDPIKIRDIALIGLGAIVLFLLGKQVQAPPSITLPSSTMFPIIRVTGSYTASLTDYTILVDAINNPITITLPSATEIAGKVYDIKKVDSGTNIVSITTKIGSAQTIDGSIIRSTIIQYESITVQSDGHNWFVL